MAPFYGWGSTTSRLEPLREGSLLFTTNFPEIPGTHFIDLGRMKLMKSQIINHKNQSCFICITWQYYMTNFRTKKAKCLTEAFRK